MAAYGSDLVVDLLRAHGIHQVTMNPGASWRGLHDSLVNYGRGDPELFVCTHEKLAVLMAAGYAKVTGEPIAAILHDVVGLMQGTMGIYTAYMDQVPVLVLGGTGPMAAGKRRPHFEWAHTAFAQGGLVRDFVKWDDQAFDALGAVEAFRRGVQVATTEPGGPVYLCYDLAFQEEALGEDWEVPAPARVPARQFPADREALAGIVDRLLAAAWPVIIAGRVGRHREAVPWLARLAEACGAGVVDQRWRYNLATTHPLRFTGQEIVPGADAVLALDVIDLHGPLTVAGEGRGPRRRLTSPGAEIMEIRLDLLEGTGWLPKFEAALPVDVSVLADTGVALPELVALAEARRAAEAPPERERIAARRSDLEARHRAVVEEGRAAAGAGWDRSPVSTARLASELWEAVQGLDWILTGSDLNGWIDRLWDIDSWERFPGRSLGTGTQLGTAMGVALAYRGTGKVVVDLQPDGDLLFDPGALWTIRRYGLPLLVVMFNNRSYYNDVPHQVAVAAARGRDTSAAHIGMDLDDPPPDFAALARSFGWFGVGPIERPEALRAGLSQGLEVVHEKGRPALVDVVTQVR